MTAVRVDPRGLRHFAGRALDDLALLRRAIARAEETTAGLASGPDAPAATRRAEDALRAAGEAVAALTTLVAVLELVADEAERLDAAAWADGRLRGRLPRSGSEPGPGDHLRVLQALDDPRHVGVAWAAVPASDRDWLVRRRPAVIGPLHGIDVAARDRANRRLVAAEADRLRASIGAPPAAIPGDPWAPVARDEWDRHRRDVHDALQRLAQLLRADLVLAFDPAGDGRAAVAWGDVEQAMHVATFVPGMTNSLATMDAVMGDGRRLHDALVERTRARDRPATEVATVAWLGYDAPSGFLGGLLEAAGSQRAVREQGRLVDHVGMLRAVNPDASQAVVAHSYGSVLAMQALHPDPDHDVADVDRLVVLGSPGGGRGVRERDDLQLARGGFFTAATPGDLVTLVPLLGPDPGTFDDVVPVPQGGGNRFHGGYLASGSLGAANVARAVLGLPLREVATPWAPRRVLEAARPRTPWTTPVPDDHDDRGQQRGTSAGTRVAQPGP